MLKDYFWSLTFVASILMAYTGLVLYGKKSADVHFEPSRSAASLKPKIDPATEAIAPVALPETRISN